MISPWLPLKRPFASNPANPRHYKCGALMIVEVLKTKPTFSNNLALAKIWYKKALALGIHPAELAEVKRILEKKDRLSIETSRA